MNTQPVYQTSPPTRPRAAWLRPLVSLSDGVDRLCTLAFVTATIAFALVMALGVFFRYALNNSLTWADEVGLMIFIWATFLSIASGYLHDKHVNLDVLVNKLSPLWQARATVLAEGLALSFLAALTVSSMQNIPLAAGVRSDALRLPMTVSFLAIPVACVIMDLHWLRRNLSLGLSWGFLIKLLVAGLFLFVFMLPIGDHVQFTGGIKAISILCALFIPMLLGVPVALSLGFVATFYAGSVGGIPFNIGAEQISNGISLLALMAIPLLMLAGKLMHEAGVAQYIVDLAQVLVGRLRGGLGAANVVASFIFGDISGSAVSDTAAIGSVMIPQMKARGYRAEFCAALQGTSGTLGMMAPLAITILLYAAATNTSISRLAAATVVPSILLAASFVLVALVHGWRHNYPREIVPASSIMPRLLNATPGLFALVLVVILVQGTAIPVRATKHLADQLVERVAPGAVAAVPAACGRVALFVANAVRDEPTRACAEHRRASAFGRAAAVPYVFRRRSRRWRRWRRQQRLLHALLNSRQATKSTREGHTEGDHPEDGAGHLDRAAASGRTLVRAIEKLATQPRR